MKTETVAPAETLYVGVMFDDFSRTPVKDWQSDWESRKAAKQALKNIALSFEPNKQFKMMTIRISLYRQTSRQTLSTP